jgi:hypothetical protein
VGYFCKTFKKYHSAKTSGDVDGMLQIALDILRSLKCPICEILNTNGLCQTW